MSIEARHRFRARGGHRVAVHPAELGDRLVVRIQPPQQPQQLHVAAALRFQTARGIESYVDSHTDTASADRVDRTPDDPYRQPRPAQSPIPPSPARPRTRRAHGTHDPPEPDRPAPQETTSPDCARRLGCTPEKRNALAPAKASSPLPLFNGSSVTGSLARGFFVSQMLELSCLRLRVQGSAYPLPVRPSHPLRPACGCRCRP